MALTCVFGHKWKGCKCICGKTRDEGHDWSKDCETCSRCGAERSDAHNWKDCTCIICGLTRDDIEHSWGADLQTCTSCGRTRSLDRRLAEEAMAGHLDAVLALIDKGADVNYSFLGKMTPLSWAAHQGHVDIVRVLLDRGADVNATDFCGEPALHHAIDGDDNVAVMVRELMVRELVEKGADVHIRDNGGESASELAAVFGCAEAVQLLKAREAATKCTVDSSSVSRKDLMNEIEAILLDQSSDDQKQAKIHAVLCTLDDGFTTQTQEPSYCACGYPTGTLFRDGSSGPLFNLVASRQWSENDPYTHLYICPHCGRHIERITQ